MDQLKTLIEQQNRVFETLVRRIENLPAAQVSSVPQVPQPPPLCLTGDMEQNFNFFEENWKTYATAIGMDTWPAADAPKKVGFLLSVVGFEALKKYFNFELTDAQKASPGTALEAIKAKVVHPRNINLDIMEFLSAKQDIEPVDEYVMKLRVLAKPCNLGELENRFLTYKLVTSNKWPSLRKKLLTNKDVTLDSAIDACRLEEVSEKQAAVLNAEGSSTVNKIRRKKGKGEKQCKFCGGRHIFEKGSCPAYGQKCRKCKGKNHFEKMCSKNEKKNYKKKVKEVQNDTTSDDSESGASTDSDESEYEEIGKVHNNASKKGHVLADLSLKINGVWENVKCELDTGANASLIGYNWLRTLYGEIKPVILPSKSKLQSFGGGDIPVLGQVKIPCRRKKMKFKLVLQVVNVDHCPLLSAKVCEVLGLVKFCKEVTYKRTVSVEEHADLWIYRIEANNSVQKYEGVSKDFGGTADDMSLKTDLEVQAQTPSPRRNPTASRKRLHEELNKLNAVEVIAEESVVTEQSTSVTYQQVHGKEEVPESFENRKKMKYQYNHKSRDLPVLDVGSLVYMSDTSYIIRIGGVRQQRDNASAPLATTTISSQPEDSSEASDADRSIFGNIVPSLFITAVL